MQEAVQNLKVSDGNDVSKHMNEFTELADKLLLVIMLLSSLSGEFEHFVVAIKTRNNLPVLSLGIICLSQKEKVMKTLKIIMIWQLNSKMLFFCQN